MTTFAVPSTVAPSSIDLRLISNTWRFTSPYTGASQTLAMPGTRWAITLSWSWLKASEAGEYEAFLAKLQGGAHYFSAYNFHRPAPLGTMRGSLTVNGAHAAGVSTIAITGGAGQAGRTLLAGDLIGIAAGLFMVTANATANGSGEISVSVHRPTRGALTGGEPVTWDKPTCTFVQTDGTTGWQYERSIARNFVLAGEEVI